MGGGRIGEMVFSDPPGSFGAMSVTEKMEFEQSIRRGREEREQRRRNLQEEIGQRITENTVEHQGENND